MVKLIMRAIAAVLCAVLLLIGFVVGVVTVIGMVITAGSFGAGFSLGDIAFYRNVNLLKERVNNEHSGK